MELEKKKEIVAALIKKGILIDTQALQIIDLIQKPEEFKEFIIAFPTDQTGAIKFFDVINRYKENRKTATDNTADNKTQSAPTPTNRPAEQPEKGKVRIIFSYEEQPKKREVQDFTSFFTARYNTLKNILMNRKELQNLTSINRLNQKKEREQIAIIGLISDKQETKTGKIVLNVEDPTGQMKAIFSENSDTFDIAKDTVFDEVVGIVGTCTGSVIFGSKIILPDIPAYNEVKKSPDEAYALFIGDFHYGSNVFLDEPFEKFISWLRGEQGNEQQKEVARKVKYVFISGDLVEGVGIYPDQEKDLKIIDIYEQYKGFAAYLRKIPSHIKIIICPGNHDAMRIAEPQPPLYKDFAEAVWNLPNVIMVSNPAYVNIHASEKFTGFDVLMYHGFSFIYYSDAVESIRSAGGQERVDMIMKFLLQRRHLAPAHKSTLYLPDAHKDSLVIDKVPDFFVSGHIHRASASNYRNVTMLNCSSWLRKTEYQEKVGLHPQPGRAILVNLQTRKVKILKFYDDPDEKNQENQKTDREQEIIAR